MARDIPHRHLLRDEVLLKLASDLVLNASSLGDIDGLSERTRTRYEQALLTCIGSAQTETPTNTEAPVNLQPYAGEMKRWKEIVQQWPMRITGLQSYSPTVGRSRNS
jgi:ribonuclease D